MEPEGEPSSSLASLNHLHPQNQREPTTTISYWVKRGTKRQLHHQFSYHHQHRPGPDVSNHNLSSAPVDTLLWRPPRAVLHSPVQLPSQGRNRSSPTQHKTGLTISHSSWRSQSIPHLPGNLTENKSTSAQTWLYY